MYVDANLEAQPGWGQRADESVGGPKPYVPPDDFGMVVIQSKVEREFFIEGPAYTDGLFSIHRPIRTNTGKLSLRFDLKVSAESALYAQALEFDTRLAISKMGYNFSSQFNQQKGGVWQVYIKGQGWVDTPFNPGKFPPEVWVPVKFDYAFDIVKKTYSFLAVTVGTATTLMPAKFHNLPATPLQWADSANFQVQLDLNSKGGAYSHRISEADFIWS
jgi:hypothetical protein